MVAVNNRWNKINVSLFPATSCTEIVPFNTTLNSTIGIPRISKFLRDITYINTRCLDIFVGILLGDAYFKLGKNQTNVRIGFKQSLINFPFMWKVFTEISHYCSSLPRYEVATLKILKVIKNIVY